MLEGLLLILIEIIFLAAVILVCYSLKRWFGLAFLYIFIGSIQYLQTVLSATLFIPLWGDFGFSPGSAVLFGSNIFAILLIYLKEDILKTRTLVYGILISNIALAILSTITSYQMSLENSMNFLNLSHQIFNVNLRIFMVGTVTLIIDSIAIIIIFEFLFFKLKRSYIFFLILLASVIVMILDSLLFVTGSYIGQPDFMHILINNMSGKIFSGFVYAFILSVYLVYIDKNNFLNHHGAPSEIKDLFSILTYRKKYEHVKKEKEKEVSLLTQRLDLAARSMNMGVWEFNIKANKLFWDDLTFELFGQKKGTARAEDIWAKTADPDDQKKLELAIQTAITKGEDLDNLYRITCEDGSIRYIQSKATVHLNKEGEPLMVLGVNWDVTERVSSEKELLKYRPAPPLR